MEKHRKHHKTNALPVNGGLSPIAHTMRKLISNKLTIRLLFLILLLLAIFSSLFLNNSISEYFKQYYLSYQFVSATSGKRYFEYPVRDISLLQYQYANSRAEFRKQLNRVFSNYTAPKYIDKWHQKIIVNKTGDQKLDRHITSVITGLLKHGINIDITQSDTLSNGNLLIHRYGGDDKNYQFGLDMVLSPGWMYKYNWPDTVHVDRKMGFNDYNATIESITGEPFVLYRDAVPFTFKSLEQVEGYYQVVTNSKGVIKKAECYIFDKHEIAIKKSLITECIVRSLGFSGLISGKSILSSRDTWDETYIYPTELDYLFLNILYNLDITYFERANLLSTIKQRKEF